MKKFTYIFICFFLLMHSSYALTSHVDLTTLMQLSPPLELEVIHEKVKPTITYAVLRQNDSGFYKGEIVEVLQDVANGKHYEVSNSKLKTWVHGYNLKFIELSPPSPLPLYPNELEAYMNASNHSSQTPYFVWVDLARQLIYVFNKTDDHWSLCKFLLCASGKLTTPTIRGIFEVQDKGLELLGAEKAKYWVRFHSNYLFHSLPLDVDHNIIDTRLGIPISNGCIRMHEEDAKWFFDTIPAHTTVWIY